MFMVSPGVTKGILVAWVFLLTLVRNVKNEKFFELEKSYLLNSLVTVVTGCHPFGVAYSTWDQKGGSLLK